MARKQSKHRISRRTKAEITRELCAELRSVFRQIDQLRRPLNPSEFEEDGERRYLLRVVAEDIQTDVLRLAGAVWHLGDRLPAWLRAAELSIKPGIRDIANDCLPLRLCADLFNAKKHGGNDNRSGHSPLLSGVSLELPALGLRYDGALAEGEFVLKESTPIQYTVEIRTGDGKATFGDAIDVICKGLDKWLDVLLQADFLQSDDRQIQKLAAMVTRFKNDERPIVLSDLLDTVPATSA